MKYVTLRNIPADLAAALRREKRRRGISLNQTVLDLLRQSLGLAPGLQRSNGLHRLAGTWTPEEHQRFEADLAITEQVDAELWR